MTRVNALGTSPLSIDQGGTAVTTVTTVATASAWAAWNAQANFSVNNVLAGSDLIVSSGGTTTLTVASPAVTIVSGTMTETIVMPVTSTLTQFGQSFAIINVSTGNVTVQSSGANTIQVMASGTKLVLTCISLSGTTAASWHADYNFTGGGVDAITGTASQVLVNGDTAPHTGDVTLTLPQNIATTSNVTFGSLTATNLTFDVTANTIASTNTNGNINLIPNGTGVVNCSALGTSGLDASFLGSNLIVSSNAFPTSTIAAFVNNVGGRAGSLAFVKSRSLVPGSYVALQSGDNIGLINWYGDDGTSLSNAGFIQMNVSGSVSTGIVPSQLLLGTSNTSGTNVTALTISNAQILTLAHPLPAGSGGTGVASLGTGVATALGQNVNGSGAISLTTSPVFVTPTLGAATATSINFGGTTLSTYTEGTFTPTITAATVGDLSVVYTNQTGTYTRIGNLIFCNVRVSFTPTYTTASGSLQIASFPFTISADSAGAIDFISAGFIWPVGHTSLSAYAQGGTTYCTLSTCGTTANSAADIPITGLVTGVAVSVQFSITYRI